MFNKDQKNQIQKQISIKELSKREERYTYYGLMSTYQLYGIKDFDYMLLNQKQHKLFKTVLHGYGAYTKQQVSNMPYKKRKKIAYLWSKGQDVINRFKQEVSAKYANEIFSMFKMKYVKCILDIPAEETSKDLLNDCSFKDLGIEYEDIVLLFLKHKLLPENFFNIK
jgi:hypothetical protein